MSGYSNRTQLVTDLQNAGVKHVGPSFCPQSAYALLVVEMPGRTQSRKQPSGQSVSPIFDLGYNEKAAGNRAGGQASQSRDGEKCGAVSQKKYN